MLVLFPLQLPLSLFFALTAESKFTHYILTWIRQARNLGGGGEELTAPLDSARVLLGSFNSEEAYAEASAAAVLAGGGAGAGAVGVGGVGGGGAWAAGGSEGGLSTTDVVVEW